MCPRTAEHVLCAFDGENLQFQKDSSARQREIESVSQRTGRVNSSELLLPPLNRLLRAPERRSRAGRTDGRRTASRQKQMQDQCTNHTHRTERVEPVPTRTISVLQQALLQRCIATRFANDCIPGKKKKRPLQFFLRNAQQQKCVRAGTHLIGVAFLTIRPDVAPIGR